MNWQRLKTFSLVATTTVLSHGYLTTLFHTSDYLCGAVSLGETNELAQNTLIIAKTHYTGDMFRLNNGHHQDYVNVQTSLITIT
jgi:hypothetical protein